MLYQIKLMHCLMIALVSESVFKAPDSWKMVKNIYTLSLLTVPNKKRKKNLSCQYSLFSFGNQFSSSLHSILLPLTTQISLIIGVRHRAKCFKGIFLFNLLDNPGRQWWGHCWLPTQQPVWLFLKSRDVDANHVACSPRDRGPANPVPPAPGVGSDWSKLCNPILLPVIGSGIQAQANQLQVFPSDCLLSLKLGQLDWKDGILFHDLGAESLLLGWMWTRHVASVTTSSLPIATKEPQPWPEK